MNLDSIEHMTDPNMYDKIIELSNSGKSVREIMKEVGFKSTSSVTYYLKMHQAPSQKRREKTIVMIRYHEREILRLKALLQNDTDGNTLSEVYDE